MPSNFQVCTLISFHNLVCDISIEVWYVVNLSGYQFEQIKSFYSYLSCSGRAFFKIVGFGVLCVFGVRPPVLLDDTTLNVDQYKMKLVDSPVCDCDEDLETNYHFLMECRQYNDARNIMVANIQKMWMDTKATGILNTTMELILGSCSVFNLDKELVKYIKVQLFQYLRSTGRNI